MTPSKPKFQSVVDLGLRDVGVRNDPRRLVAQFGRASAGLFVFAVLSVIALCAIVTQMSVGGWIVIPFVLAWTVAVLVVGVRSVRRAPPVVVRIDAAGKNQATWVLIVPFVLLAVQAALVELVLAIPAAALAAVMTVMILRNRGHVPEVLRTVRDALGPDETVLGDGIGLVQGGRGRDSFRVIVATDRRLIVAARGSSLVMDEPYERLSRYGFAWKYWGRTGVLSLNGVDGSTQVIAQIAPANLLSIARVLGSSGVDPDDPGALPEAERQWEEAQRQAEEPPPLIDRAAMRTRAFDRALWALLALSAVILYPRPFGDGAAMLIAFAVVCLACGYASRTRSSLAYLIPFNVLLAPSFFLATVPYVVAGMILLNAVAAICLWTGSALRRSPARVESPGAEDGFRHALSGARLVRLTGAMLAVVLTLVVVASAAGFDLSTLRLALREATSKQVPVDGRSNLTGNAASLTYTPGPDLRELVTDEDWGAGPNDGARWELRTSFTKGDNGMSLAHYIFTEPRLDDPAAVAEFVAGKDREHSRIAGFRVPHRKRVVAGRPGYEWRHQGRQGYWHRTLWFPHPVHTVRLECVANRQVDRFKRLCAEAVGSLSFR